MKLVQLIPLRDGKHKYAAHFVKDNGKPKMVNFGQAGADDYTLTGDKEQRDRYRRRHEKDLKTGDPTRAGYLSYYLLWGDSKDLNRNLAAYRRKFNL